MPRSLNTSLVRLKSSGIRRINALAAQHPGCIALSNVVIPTIRPITELRSCAGPSASIWPRRASITLRTMSS